MSPIDRLNEIEQQMDEAFTAGPGSKEEEALVVFLASHPEYQPLWQEYQNLRSGMTTLAVKETPSEVTRARIRHAAHERLKTVAKGKRGWRWLMSQPLVAAATVLLVVGVGIYSQHLLREEKKAEQKLPTMEPGQSSAGKPAQDLEEPLLKFRKALPPEAEAPTEKFKFEFPTAQPSPAKAIAPPTPASGAGSERAGGTASEPPPAAAPELKAQRLAPPSRYELLVSQAKEKIAAQDCPAALKLLQEAQHIQDTTELQALIKKCQKN
jgi:hypothetical protein